MDDGVPTQRRAAADAPSGDPRRHELVEIASALRAELAMAAAGIGTFDWDLLTGVLDWDERLVEMFGYSDEDTFDRSIEAFNARLHPDDLEPVTGALQRAIDACGSFSALYRICLPGDVARWVSARGKVLCDPAGMPVRLLGAAYDITDQRGEELGAGRVLEAMPAGFYSLDTGWRFTYVNGQAEALLGHSKEELLGQVLWESFPAAVGSEFEENYRRALATDGPVAFDAYYPAPLDGWYEVRAWPTSEGLSVYFLEVTDRQRAQHDAQRANDHLALLAQVSHVLASSLSTDVATRRVPALAVPALADACIVSVLGDHGRRGEVGSWHADAAVRPLLAEFAQARLDLLPSIAPVAHAMASGEPVDVPGEEAIALAPAGPARDLLTRLAPTAVFALPLRGRGRTLGLLTLMYLAGQRPSGHQLSTAKDLADRVGLALDNARLYAQQQQLAEQLQRSMLTAPPEPDHAHIVVRYLPAAESAAVGGDWYDAFLQHDGATMLVIGDVAGHDTTAAATMGQLRSLLRGIATSSDIGPAEILTRLDSSMSLLQVDTLATAAVARFEQTPGERAEGITRIRWANAGHLPPLVVGPAGSVTVLTTEPAERLLGVDPQVRRSESVATLGRDATVLLYTDGLVERRDADLDAGLDRLRATLSELHRLPLDQLCDAVLERLVDGRLDDDVALVAVRLHRQDRPRPVAAGPQWIPEDVSVPPSTT